MTIPAPSTASPSPFQRNRQLSQLSVLWFVLEMKPLSCHSIFT